MKKISVFLVAIFLFQIVSFAYGIEKYSKTDDVKIVMTETELNELISGACGDVTDAAVIEVPIAGGIDLESFFTEIRIAELISFKGTTYTGLYMPIVSLKSDNLELVNLVFGGAFKNTDAKGYPMVSVTLRIDGILGKIGAIKWISEHLHIAKFPSVEFGPFASYDFVTPQEIYGLLFAYKFGGK